MGHFVHAPSTLIDAVLDVRSKPKKKKKYDSYLQLRFSTYYLLNSVYICIYKVMVLSNIKAVLPADSTAL